MLTMELDNKVMLESQLSQQGPQKEYEIISIIVTFGRDEKELIQGVKAEKLPNGDLTLCSIVNELKKIGYPVEGAMVSYLSTAEQLFVHCGNEPLPATSVVPAYEVEKEKRVTIKFRSGLKPSYSTQQNNSATTNNTNANNSTPVKQGRRTKERKIGFIIEKVALWRKLYNGVVNENGETVRYSLEEAAQKVGISKKSLDDYLLQLRFGRKFGFNFNDHKNDKVGVLRAFVKKHKQIEKLKKEGKSAEDAEKLAKTSEKKEDFTDADAVYTPDHSLFPDRCNMQEFQQGFPFMNGSANNNAMAPSLAKNGSQHEFFASINPISVSGHK